MVPSSSTIPRTSSAPTAAARCNGETIAVTFNVASTSTNIEASVIAMINTVVRMEARIRFMDFRSGKVCRRSSLTQTRPIVGHQYRVHRICWIVLDAGRLPGNQALEADLAFEASNILRGVIGDPGNSV